MQQAEHADTNGAVSPTVDSGTSEQASSQVDKETIAVMRQKVYAINSISMLLIGLLLSYFPQYIQANIPFFNTGTEIMALLAFVACGKTFYDAYPRFFTHDNNMLLGSIMMSVVGYLLSDLGVSYVHTTIHMFPPMTLVDIYVFFRVASFFGLITLIGNLTLRTPSFVRFYEQRKGKFWRSITSKKNIAPILGGLSVVTALCTALLQIVQIVSGLLHW